MSVYFIFSAIFNFFLSPLNWAIMLLVIAVFLRHPKWKKRLFRITLVILLLFSNTWLLNLYASCWNVAPAKLDKGKIYSADIILGGFTNQDKFGQGAFNEHADRFIEGLKLKQTGKVSHILVSGGNATPRGDNFTEGVWAKGRLEELGVPDSAILAEDSSRNTVENAAFSKRMLMASHLQPPYILVTSAYHMRRAMYIFKKAGMDVLPYPCDYTAGNTNIIPTDYFIPSLNTLNTWPYYIKEVFGMMAAYFR
ncbi:MAG TPA: YdcF family protein [Mucilaginibacter sp.]|nr:YdcF family protein [Mucilaginibacter sp.]